MLSKACGIAVLLLSGFAVCVAQDPTKVESSHYKIAFENPSVQVVNVHYGPHEKSGMRSSRAGCGGYYRRASPVHGSERNRDRSFLEARRVPLVPAFPT